MNDLDVKNIIDFTEAAKPSELENEYTSKYGPEFVNDLKQAYYWMRRDMRHHPAERVRRNRRKIPHEIGDWHTVFFVDFYHENFYAQTIDSNGGKTIHNFGHSPCLKTDSDHNVRYLLSGMFYYDSEKTRHWLTTLLGAGEHFWYEEA